MKPDIIFLQEMHTGVNDQHRPRAYWISQVYQAPFTRKARGITILFRKNISFRLDSVTADPYGRYLMISGHISYFPITMLNIYNPNADKTDIFCKALIPAPVSSSGAMII